MCCLIKENSNGEAYMHSIGVCDRRTLNLSRAFCAHVLIIQIPDLLFLRRGQRSRVAGECVCADDDAVGHRANILSASQSSLVQWWIGDLVRSVQGGEWIVVCTYAEFELRRSTALGWNGWWFEIDIYSEWDLARD